MELLDDQTTELLREYGVSVPAFDRADSPEAARDLCAELGGRAWVVKAGLRPSERVPLDTRIECASPEAVARAAAALLGQPVESVGGTAQATLDRVLVEVAQEATVTFYLGLAIDRVLERIVLIGSPLGGSSIADIALKVPESIIHLAIDPAVGLQSFQARRFFLELGLPAERLAAGAALLESVFAAFVDLEATAVEINRLTLEADTLLARDVTLLFDRGALFRHPRMREFLERDDPSSAEALAAEFDLRVVPMSGTVGLVVSGQGLGAATTDLLREVGLEPRAVVDIGTSATPRDTAAALRLVLTKPEVDRVLVNVFAGLNRCDWVAQGIIAAMAEVELTFPVVARLAGTKVHDGRKLLEESGIDVRYTSDLGEAIAMVADTNGVRIS
jgi:malate-CoA ligase subunit beta